jgi:cell filamentation protein, protein adenylyltransferase
MARITGDYRTTTVAGETVRAFIPLPLPPQNPALHLDEAASQLLIAAEFAVGRLAVAAMMVPSPEWFLYGYVRKEAVVSSQIEGTQATLTDLLTFEATHKTQHPDDVQDVCNYLAALTYARAELKRSDGLPLSTRLLCAAHKRLMKGVRGEDKQPGELRRSQNWIGGSRPGNAMFVPPPADEVVTAMADLDRWIHASDSLPPLVRAGLAHVQFETIHPFLDGSGRIGRLLITLLVEHWRLLTSPLLYLSVAIKRRQAEYYQRLSAVREGGDWEGWTRFFLECVRDAADDGVSAAQRVFALTGRDRQRLLARKETTIPAVRLFDDLPNNPVVTLARVMTMLKTTKPTALKAIDALVKAGILHETTGKERDRVFAYEKYLQILTRDV